MKAVEITDKKKYPNMANKYAVITDFERTDAGDECTDRQIFDSIDKLFEFVLAMRVCDKVYDLYCCHYDNSFADLLCAPHKIALDEIFESGVITEKELVPLTHTLQNAYYRYGKTRIYSFSESGIKKKISVVFDDDDGIRVGKIATAIIEQYDDIELI